MTKSLQTAPSKGYFPRPQTWTWEKRHWLIVIGLACLMLWWISPSLKEMSWFQSSIKWLPILGGLAFATDNLLKLAQ